MHKTLGFSIQSASPNLDRWSTSAVRRVRTVSCVVGSCSDMFGSVPHCKWGVTCFSCMCGRQNSMVICNCRIVPAMQMGLQVVLLDELSMESGNVNTIASGAGGGVADRVLEEVSHEMRFWEITDGRILYFSIQIASPHLGDPLLLCDGCKTVSCVVGSCSDMFVGSVRIVNGVPTVFRACVVDRTPLWFATAGSFPQCKWDCKWCLLDELSLEFRCDLQL